MKIGAMFGDVIHSLFIRPVTERYPYERKPAPVRLRGKLVYDPGKCAGCQLCVKDCPSEAIELIVLDKVAKRFVIRYNVDRCTFCGQCVENCRFDCLSMSSEEWELAALNKESFTLYYGREEDVSAILEKEARKRDRGPVPHNEQA